MPRRWARSFHRSSDAEHELRVFAQDGTGGLVAFWMVVADQPLEAQPIVFLGSEGTVGPVARDLPDFFALLASGLGPYEVVENGVTEADARLLSVEKLGDKHFGKRKKRSPSDIVAEASAAYGDIEDRIKALNKHR